MASFKSKIKGCFEREGKIGSIDLKGFYLKIKSLNTDWTFQEQFKQE
jgi:hypothetical protein